MKTLLTVAGALALALSLSACNTTTTSKMLDNLSACERHYDGAVSGGMSGGQFSGTVKIDCKGATVASVSPPA